MSGTPVGVKDVVKMNYYIGYGVMDNGLDGTIAWTESFKEGVSLSDIQWTFVNSATQGGKETTGKITFTIHDIAGTMFNKYMHLKTGIDWIYYWGPDSEGNLWGGDFALYMVDAENCSLEFSATQGFTYTIAGISAYAVARTKQMVCPASFGITGVESGGSPMFATALEVDLLKTWNEKLKSCKKVGAEVVIEYDTTVCPDYFARSPKTVDTKDAGTPTTFNYQVAQNTTIADAIVGLWNDVYATNSDKENKVRCRVDFKEWKGGPYKVIVKFTDKTVEDAVDIGPMYICVGDDINCAGAEYRGELASIGLNDMSNRYLLHMEKKPKEADGVAPKGAEEPTPPSCPSTETAYGSDFSSKDGAETPWHASNLDDPQEQDKTNYWHQMYKLVQDGFVAELEIEVNMPYTHDFTPKSQGGKLADALEGLASVIHMKQGAYLDFYWYKDPNCAELIRNPVISSTYRISEVNHQIGLGGNQTVVKLSHLQLGTG